MDRATRCVLRTARLKSRRSPNRRGVALRDFSPSTRSPVRAGVIFQRCLKPDRDTMRTSSSAEFDRLRRVPRSPGFPVADGTPILSADQRGGRGVARAEKGRAVLTQCADGIFARGGAAAFYLAHRRSARLAALLLSRNFDTCALRITASMKQCDYMPALINPHWPVPLGSKAQTRRVPRTWTEVAQRLMAHGNP